MRGFLILAILLAFPVLEIFTLVQVADIIGWWLLLLWLLIAALIGGRLLRGVGLDAPARLLAALQSGQSLGASLWYGFIPFIAGILLIFPGVISDVIALILLLIPVRRSGMPPAANDEVIEGEWHEVDDNRDRLQ
jgi:UPF0716 protein FxsA